MGLKDLINKLRKQKLDQDIAAAEAANVLPAPTPSTSVTPQQALNRTVAVVKKVNENIASKANGDLKVWANDGTAHNLSEMDGSTADKTLLTRQFNATKLATKANANLIVYGENDAKVELSTMDGSTSAKALVTRNRADAVAQYWANQVGNTKQPILTRTLTLVLDDGTTTDIKVG